MIDRWPVRRLLLSVFIVVSVFLTGCQNPGGRESKISFTTPYQAVLLDNGRFFYAKVDQSLPGFLILTNVYYIEGVQDPATKQVKNILIQRGKEWHSPDRMFLNLRHVVAIEPVATDSKISQLIKQQNKTGK